MTALAVAIWRATPGQFGTFFGQIGQAKAMHERHGLGVTVWNAVYAGTNSMTLAYVTSAADVATHAAQSTETISDPAWITFWDGALNANPPSAALVSNSLSVSLPEVASDPIGPNTTGTPRAVETFMWGPMAPAARAALVDLVGVLKPIVHERGGTINVRLSLVGGPAGAGVALSIGSPSMAAWGASRQASAENAALVAAVQKAGAVTGPPISNSLLSEIVM